MKNKKQTKKKSGKAFFFLRHNNDIDQIVPVIHKWLSNENIPTDIIILTKRKTLDDFRINLLKEFNNARAIHIKDLFGKYRLAHYVNIYSLCFKLRIFLRKYRTLRKLFNKLFKKDLKQIFEDVEKGIVVFDWIESFFPQEIVKMAKKKGLTTVSLPHGDAPYFNYMEKKDDLNYTTWENKKKTTIYDYLVVPNHLVYNRYKDSPEKDKIKILGSARYSDEWLNIISKSIPNFEIEGSENKLKIVFFLRNTTFPIFWDEVVRTMKLIIQFPNVYLVVKHHPRDIRNAKQITKSLFRLYPDVKRNLGVNLKFIYGEVSSDSLIKWADIIIDLGTSVAWEPIKKGMPVLLPEYLHSSYSTVAHYIKASELKCRDHLYDTLKEFTENKNQEFYNEKERRKFIKEIIDVPDKHVLERYYKFLEKCLNESSEKK